LACGFENNCAQGALGAVAQLPPSLSRLKGGSFAAALQGAPRIFMLLGEPIHAELCGKAAKLSKKLILQILALYIFNDSDRG